MLRGLWKLTWLEIKIFMREPLGLIGTVGLPVAIYVLTTRVLGGRAGAGAPEIPRFISIDLPVLGALLVATNAVLSLVAIIAIYREGKILKRLRATPLRPQTILSAHVLVKLLSTALSLGAMFLAGRRISPLGAGAPLVSFTLAVLLTTLSILSLGFLIASVVPTARFAQPLGTIILYPMLGISGLFVPLNAMPPVLRGAARLFPLTYAVSLLRGIWSGESWAAHSGDVAALVAALVVFTMLSARAFRWE